MLKALKSSWNCFRGRHVPYICSDGERMITLCTHCMKRLPMHGFLFRIPLKLTGVRR